MAFRSLIMIAACSLGACCLVTCGQAPPTPADEPVVIRVTGDDVVIDQSCIVHIDDSVITDARGDGVIQITAPNVTVQFTGGPLRGAPADADADTFTGIGILILAPGVTIEGATVHGFKVGILAVEADGLVVEGADVSDNYAARLKSNPRVEESGDWLRPHDNDHQEWRYQYGAGLCVERSRNIEIRHVLCRRTQNGIILDTVTNSQIYDNDCSFLSGWGIALWRSSGNMISRNSFDFCVRGYSHGRYNRGQDSAGILLFEQCSDNKILYNSATHCGDGFFAFAGSEALGQRGDHPAEWYEGRGNNRNVIAGNDFSYAAAHGLELTFSFDNVIQNNRFTENAICGIWGGYSQRTTIIGNTFVGNGESGYGEERGGINIEHGRENVIVGNTFRDNKLGIHLWWDEDKNLTTTPWARANLTESSENTIAGNRFDGDAIGIRLRRCGVSYLRDNGLTTVDQETDFDTASSAGVRPGSTEPLSEPTTIAVASGQSEPVGARSFGGRDQIVIAPWGPVDPDGPPQLVLMDKTPLWDSWRVIGATPGKEPATATGNVRVSRGNDGTFNIFPKTSGEACVYDLTVLLDDASTLKVRGLVGRYTFKGFAFPSLADPRTDYDSWKEQGAANGFQFHTRSLNCVFGAEGPSSPRFGPLLTDFNLPADHFGLSLEATIWLPDEPIRIRTTSDDGIRIWADDVIILENWTHHAPTNDEVIFTPPADHPVHFLIEYFELDGHAELKFEISLP